MNIRISILFSALIALFLIPTLGIMAQGNIQQSGVTYRYNGKNQRTPLGKVYIKVATSPNGVLSDSISGHFTLQLPNQKMGSRIEGVTVQKRGMMVFNQQAVDEWSIRQEPLCLILCDKDEFEKQKQDLIAIGLRQAKKKYDERIAEIEAKYKVESEEWFKKMSEAEIQLQELQKQLDKYADFFVRIDMSEVSVEEQHILDMVHEGRIEEALKAYENLGLIEKLESEVASYQELSNAVKLMENNMAQRKSNVRELYDAVMRQVSTLLLVNKEIEAEMQLLSLLEKITPMFEDSPEEYRPIIAKIHAKLGEVVSPYTSKRDHLIIALNEYKNLSPQNLTQHFSDYSYVLYCLGFLYSVYDETKAESFLLSAIDNYTKLYKQDPYRYVFLLAEAKEHLGNFYAETNHVEQALHFYIEVLDMMESISNQNSYAINLILESCYNKLGKLYETHLSNTKAETAYLQGLSNLWKLAYGGIDEYGEDLNKRQGEVLSFYINKMCDQEKVKNYIQREKLLYIELIDSISKCFKQDPSQYGDKLVMIQDNFISFCENLQFESLGLRSIYNPNEFDFVIIEKLYNGIIGECFQILLENDNLLYRHNPQKNGLKLAELQDRLGDYYLSYKKDTINAENYYLMELETYNHLCQLDSVKYGMDFAMKQHAIGYFYKNCIIDTTKAEDYLNKAELNFVNTLVLITTKYQVDSLKYGEDLAHAQNTMGDLCLMLGDSVKAEDYYQMELDTYIQLSELNRGKYGGKLARMLESKAESYNNIYDPLDYLFNKSIDGNAKAKAEDFYLKAEMEYAKLFALSWELYGESLAEIQEALADFYHYRMHDKLKEEEYRLKSERTNAQLATFDIVSYGPFLTLRQESLARFYENDMKDRVKAEEFYLKALATCSRLFEEVPNNSKRRELADHQYKMKSFYANDDRKLELYDAMLEASLANYEILFREDGWDSDRDYLAVLRIQKGWRYLDSGNVDEAISIFESAYKLNPELSAKHLASGYNYKAYEYARSNNYTKAIKTIEKAISLNPGEANFYDSKGEILLMKGDEEGALKMWKKVMDLDSDFLSKYNGSTELYRGLKERGLLE